MPYTGDHTPTRPTGELWEAIVTVVAHSAGNDTILTIELLN